MNIHIKVDLVGYFRQSHNAPQNQTGQANIQSVEERVKMKNSVINLLLMSGLYLLSSCSTPAGSGSVESTVTADSSSVESTVPADSSSVESTVPVDSGSVEIRVAVVNGAGDVKPVTSHKFMVMPFCVDDLRKEYSPGLSDENLSNFQAELERRYAEAEEKGQVFEVEPNLDGEIVIESLPVGEYCISNDSVRVAENNWELIGSNNQILGCYVYWRTDFQVQKGKITQVELSNDDAYDTSCPRF